MTSHLVICSRVSRDTHSLDGQQRHKRLTDLIIQSCFTDLLNVDVIGMLEDGDLFASDLA